ncbi:hypothetical protein [Nocardioides sp. P5_E3]
MEVRADIAWSRFTRLLAARLIRVTSDRSFTVWMTDDNDITTGDEEDEMYDEMDGTQPYIRGLGDQHGKIIAEVTGNAFLHLDNQLGCGPDHASRVGGRQ